MVRCSPGLIFDPGEGEAALWRNAETLRSGFGRMNGRWKDFVENPYPIIPTLMGAIMYLYSRIDCGRATNNKVREFLNSGTFFVDRYCSFNFMSSGFLAWDWPINCTPHLFSLIQR